MSITLQRDSLVRPPIGGCQHTWPLRITATSSDPELSDKIFVYHAAMQDDLYEGDVPEAVASVSQLMELPEDAPIAADCNGRKIPFYRKNVFEFNCHSAREAEDLWEKIQSDTNDLVVNFYAYLQLQANESVTFNPPSP